MKLNEYLSITPTPYKLATGRILISVPFYNDPSFNRSVVLLLDYLQDEGAVGLILNQQSTQKVNEFSDTCNIDAPVFIGGPVFNKSLFVIHNYNGDSSFQPIIPDLYLGSNHRLLAFLEHNIIPQIKYRFFLGYSGWEIDQLEYELENSMWVIGQVDTPFIFNTPPDQMWCKAVELLGNEYSHWLTFPENLSSN